MPIGCPAHDSSMKRSLAYILGTLTAPRQTFTLIMFDAQGLSISFLCLVAAAIAWALAALALAFAGFQPWTSPWMAIPLSQYYFWQALLAVPVILAAWMLVAGFVQLGAQRSGGGGSFEATAKLVALSIAVSGLVLLIPAWLLALLALAGTVDAASLLSMLRAGGFATAVLWLLILSEAVWMTLLTSVAIRAAHKLRFRPSVRVAVPAVFLYYVFVLVFFR